MSARRAAVPAAPAGQRFRLPDGSRSAQSVWVWRAFFLLSLIAVGLALSSSLAGDGFYAASWGFIAAGWFSLSMWLWRQHLRREDPGRR